MINSTLREKCGHIATFLALAAASLCILPANAEGGSPAGTEMRARDGSTDTVLPDGRRLLLGGLDANGKPMQRALIASAAAEEPLSVGLVARSGHTATVMPDGRVLILGGVGVDGRVLKSVEVLDIEAKKSASVPISAFTARTEHTATVMTDGRVLIAGGLGESGQALSDVEVLDTTTGAVERIHPKLESARFGHLAALLPSSPVLVWGGFDQHDRRLNSAELYDPLANRFMTVRSEDVSGMLGALSQSGEPAITGGIPVSHATDFPIDGMLSVRFSKRLQADSLNQETVALHGPLGLVRAKVVAVEGGSLVFITPEADLQPGAHYTLLVNGPIDASGRRLPFSAVEFRTAGAGATIGRAIDNAASVVGRAGIAGSGSTSTAGSVLDGTTEARAADQVDSSENDGEVEEWVPGPQNFYGYWRTARKAPPESKASAPKAEAGVTALSGLVLRLNGRPLANVTLSIGEHRTVTDEHGYFLLRNLQAGPQTLVIDGKSANRQDAIYGYFEALVRITEGQTNALPHTIWMPKLDTENVVKIPSPTTNAVIVRSPRIPGFEVRIPAGVVLRDRSGKIVTEVGITAVPLDRAPFPQPMDFSVYYTLQPGGVVVESVDGQRVRPAELVYPNYTKAPPGTKANAWLYDPFEKGWYVYGQGQVSADARVIDMDPGVGLYEFTGSAHTFGANPGAPGPGACPSGCCKIPGGSPPGGGGNGGGCGNGAGAAGSDAAGDPVSISTGQFVYAEQDATINDLPPISVDRIYRQGNPNLGMFGYGWSSPLDWYIWEPNSTKLVLVLPNGSQVEYANITGGGCCAGQVYQHTSSPGEFYQSTLHMVSPGNNWQLTLKDGRTFMFAIHGAALIAYADRYGNTTTITRNGAGRVTRITGSTGRWLAFSLNADGTVAQVSDTLGRVYAYAYQSGLLQSVTDPENGVRSYSYDANQRLRTVTDRTNKVVVTNDYDSNGRVMTQTLANNATIQFAYTLDANGKVTQTDVTDQRGNVRRVSFDALGYITSDTYPVGKPEQQTSSFSRDSSNGRLLSMTDQLSRTTAYGYDSKGNIASVTRLYGTTDAVTTSYTYEPYFNQLASITDPLNHTWTIGFDAAHNPITVTDPLSHVTTRGFNALGQLTSITDANNHTTTFSYTGADLTALTDALSRTTSLFYDVAGRLAYLTDPLGNVTKLEYDNVGRLIKQTEPNGKFITFNYDLEGRITGHRDQNNNLTSYGYGVLGLLTSRTDGLSQVESHSYDVASKLAQITDRKGQVTGIDYDNLNRVSQVGFGATVANPTTYTSTIGYTYDAGNRATQIADSVGGTITRTYDGLDRLTQEVTPEGTVSYTYDAAGRRATMTVAGQSAVSYTWDNADRLTEIEQGTDVVTFAYDNANRRTSTTLANGVVMAYAYDNANQLTSITYSKGGIPIGDLAYAYDAAGRRTSVTGSLATSDLPAAVTTAAHNANNQLTSWAGATLTYDLNGNLTGDGTNTYTWNARDQLASLSGGSSGSFIYDGVGRRRSKTIGSTQTGFLYDGMNFVQELTGSTVNANLMTGGIDEVFLRKEGSTARHFMSDALGSVIALTDAAGAVQTQYSYEPYGKTTVGGTANANSQRYTGREDDGTGLFYYRARYYMPSLGRFMAEDPIGFDDGPNIYAYVAGNPVSYADPLGLWSLGDPLPSGFVNGATGFGDGLSFGLTIGIRALYDGNNSINTCSPWYVLGADLGFAYSLVMWRRGPELTGNGWRFALWGNRTGHATGGWPHYHRAGGPGQGIGRHRPWDARRTDRHWSDRF